MESDGESGVPRLLSAPGPWFQRIGALGFRFRFGLKIGLTTVTLLHLDQPGQQVMDGAASLKSDSAGTAAAAYRNLSTECEDPRTHVATFDECRSQMTAYAADWPERP